jgi:hypothetical protein
VARRTLKNISDHTNIKRRTAKSICINSHTGFIGQMHLNVIYKRITDHILVLFIAINSNTLQSKGQNTFKLVFDIGDLTWLSTEKIYLLLTKSLKSQHE